MCLSMSLLMQVGKMQLCICSYTNRYICILGFIAEIKKKENEHVETGEILALVAETQEDATDHINA